MSRSPAIRSLQTISFGCLPPVAVMPIRPRPAVCERAFTVRPNRSCYRGILLGEE